MESANVNHGSVCSKTIKVLIFHDDRNKNPNLYSKQF